MEAMDVPSDSERGSSVTRAVATRTRTRVGWLRWIPLTLAVLWLIASVVVGVELIQEGAYRASTLHVSTPNLSASSDHVYYGGDAYTGIQNAASDTEHAVVEGVNQSAAFQLALQQAINDQTSRRSSSMQSQIQKGLGFLIIGVGVLNFTVALTRRSD